MSNLNIYGFTVEGKNENHIRKRYIGVAPDLESAMPFADKAAIDDGWEIFEYTDISLIGSLSFFVLPPDDCGFVDELNKANSYDDTDPHGVHFG